MAAVGFQGAAPALGTPAVVRPAAAGRPRALHPGAIGAIGAAATPLTAAQGGAAPGAMGAQTLATPGALAAQPAGTPGGLDAAPISSSAAGLAPPRISGEAAVLADERTGQVLFERDSDKPRAMASTTKVMTALLALERLNQSRTVVIGTEPARVGEESLELEPGERLTVRQLLLGLLVKSANDAAVALADAVDGSAAVFVRRMNARAAQLHLDSTHYVTPFGLDRPGHHTSARDLARLWEVAMRRPDFRALVATRAAHLPGTGRLRRFTSTNLLLGSYEWVDGGKTGFTNDAGRCLVASATRGGRRLVAVVLGSKDAFPDVRALFEYGFTAFDWVRVAERGQGVSLAPSGGQPAAYQVTADADALVRRDLVDRLGLAPPAQLAPVPGAPTTAPAAVASTTPVGGAPTTAPAAGAPTTTGAAVGSTAGPGVTVTVWIQAGGQRLVALRLGPSGSASATGIGESPPMMSSVAAELVPPGSAAPVIDPFLRQAPP